jgi:hypothetical protein
VYERRGDKWEEMERVEIDEPDILNETSVRPANIDGESTWVELSGSAGAHGGTYHLFRYSGGKLEEVVNFSNTIPSVGALEDINGDGTPEVILNETDAYVFCYACGVRYVSYSVLRWDGSKMTPVELSLLPPGGSVATVARDLNDRAIKLAQGELWMDALTIIEGARLAEPDDQTVAWNAALIKLIAEGRRDHVVDSPYPLLPRIFYGDYDAAVAGIRDFSPEELFHPQTPLIKGTAAEGWEEALYSAIERTTGKAIEADPQRAGAYFFRGWARWRAAPDSPEAISDLKRAAELAPDEELFGFVSAYVTNQ